MLSATVPSTARYGRLDIDWTGLIKRFAEKDPAATGPGPINAGLYLFSAAWLGDVIALRSHLDRNPELVNAIDPVDDFQEVSLLCHAVCGGNIDVTLVGKIIDIKRFDTPEKLVGYLGVFPDENSSGVDKQGQPLPPGTVSRPELAITERVAYWRRSQVSCDGSIVGHVVPHGPHWR